MDADSPDNGKPRGFWRLEHDALAAILRHDGLSWSTARAYLALGDLTRGYGREIGIVSLGQIATVSGLSRPHVVRALRHLAELGLYLQRPGKGRRVLRGVVIPSVATSGNTLTALGVAGGGNTLLSHGVTGAGNTSVATAGNRGVATQGTLQEEEEVQDPPKPPADAGGGVCDSPVPVEKEDSAVEQIERAYREIFQAGLPASWRRKITREWTDGSRELLGRIDAAAITAGRALAAKRQRTFGLGWVLRHLADKAAAEADQRLAAKGRRPTPHRRSAQADEARRRQHAQAAALAAFEDLPEKAQSSLLAEAGQRWSFFANRPDRLRLAAAGLAAELTAAAC